MQPPLPIPSWPHLNTHCLLLKETRRLQSFTHGSIQDTTQKPFWSISFPYWQVCPALRNTKLHTDSPQESRESPPSRLLLKSCWSPKHRMLKEHPMSPPAGSQLPTTNISLAVEVQPAPCCEWAAGGCGWSATQLHSPLFDGSEEGAHTAPAHPHGLQTGLCFDISQLCLPSILSSPADGLIQTDTVGSGADSVS